LVDDKPPRVAGDERAVLTSLLDYQRSSFVKKVSGVDDEDAASSPVGSGTSLLWLVNHMADAETTWVLRRFAGQQDTGAAAEAHEETVAGAVRRYRDVCARADAIIGAASLDEPCRSPDEGPIVDLRWVLAHLLEETARHAGHADILRELIDGSTGR
jgi:uncharacterized damage-inducible protein DinB